MLPDVFVARRRLSFHAFLLRQVMVDYSKWDKLDVSSGDDDADAPAAAPTVRTFSAPSRVTIGPSGASVAPAQAPPVTVAGPPDSPNGRFTRNGRWVGDPSLWLGLGYGWTQSRSDVTLTICIATACDPSASDALRRCCKLAEGLRLDKDTQRLHFCVQHKDPSVHPPAGAAVGEALAYRVDADDDVDDAIADAWELLILPATVFGAAPTCDALPLAPPALGKYLCATLPKAKVAAGAVHWWDRGCARDKPEAVVDVALLPARAGMADGAAAMQKVWAEAHEEFRRRVQARRSGDA